jgi:hypothetical protein
MSPAPGGRRPPRLSERVAARAVALAVDPDVASSELAVMLTRLAGERRVVLESALRQVMHRDPVGRSLANTRAALGLRLALAQHDSDHPERQPFASRTATSGKSSGEP